MKNLIFFFIALILYGCNTLVNESSSYDYSIEQNVGCFCPRGGEWVKLFVKSDSITKAIKLSDNSRLSYDQRRLYRTIKDLYNEISNIDTSIYDVIITIDPLHNYPSFFYFNPKPIVHGDTISIVMDAQMSYTTKNYKKIN